MVRPAALLLRLGEAGYEKLPSGARKTGSNVVAYPPYQRLLRNHGTGLVLNRVA